MYVRMYFFIVACSNSGSNTTCFIVIFAYTMFRDSYIDYYCNDHGNS